MTGTVVIAFPRSLRKAQKVADLLGASVCPYDPEAFARLFSSADRIVAIMATGIVVRSIAPLLRTKWADPAVVVVSPDLAYAIPLIGGHHGANELAKKLAPLGITPVLTTATEVMKREPVERTAARYDYDVLNRESTLPVNSAILDGSVPVCPVAAPAIVLAGPGVAVLLRKGTYVVGIGCRRGVPATEILESIRKGIAACGISQADILAFATTVKKVQERGLLEAVRSLPSHLIFLDDDTINAQAGVSPSQARKIGLAGVAEPCALALAKNRDLVMRKTVYGRVTIAIAR